MSMLHKCDDFRDMNFRYRACFALTDDDSVVMIDEVGPEVVVARDNGRPDEYRKDQLDPSVPQFGLVNKNENFALMTSRSMERSYSYGIGPDQIRVYDLTRLYPNRVRQRIRRPNTLDPQTVFYLLKTSEFADHNSALNRCLRGTTISQAIDRNFALMTYAQTPLLVYRGSLIGWLNENGEVTTYETVAHLRELIEEYFPVVDIRPVPQQDNPFPNLEYNEGDEEDDDDPTIHQVVDDLVRAFDTEDGTVLNEASEPHRNIAEAVDPHDAAPRTTIIEMRVAQRSLSEVPMRNMEVPDEDR